MTRNSRTGADPVYDSSSSSGDDYFLCDEKEYKVRRTIMRSLLPSACKQEGVTLSSNPGQLANFLCKINGHYSSEAFKSEYGINIRLTIEDIKRSLKNEDKRICDKLVLEIFSNFAKRNMKRKAQEILCLSNYPQKQRSAWRRKIYTKIVSPVLKISDQESTSTYTSVSCSGDLAVLVFKKRLCETDVSHHQGRLLIPKKQLIKNFLTAEEELKLERYRKCMVIPAKLIDPKMNEYDINVRMQMVGTSCFCYTIAKPWNKIKKENEFGVGTEVELWAFRRGESELWFNLVKV